MRTKLFIMFPAAIGFGLIAIKAGRQWVDRQVEGRMHDAATHVAAPAPVAAPPQSFGTIVVANARVTFGAELTPNMLREIPWPDGLAPKGAFAHIGEMVSKESKDQKRFALAAIEEGEAVLASKITGPGQRADLAAVLQDGMKAVTIRVSEIEGVAGFVLPGDRVDVMLARVVDKGEAFSDVILQGVKVLAIDQLNDDRAVKPSVARTVTLEVSTEEGQRLTVAQNVGSLSLALRPVGAANKIERNRRVTAAELVSSPRGHDGDFPVAGFNPNVTVSVTRGAVRTEYAVPPMRKP